MHTDTNIRTLNQHGVRDYPGAADGIGLTEQVKDVDPRELGEIYEVLPPMLTVPGPGKSRSVRGGLCMACSMLTQPEPVTHCLLPSSLSPEQGAMYSPPDSVYQEDSRPRAPEGLVADLRGSVGTPIMKGRPHASS
jgi:hypothetical protein